MATLIAEAVEIITDSGLGVPMTGLSLSQYGLNTDGHFYLITDRFGLNGSKTITGDTTQTVWYERILSRDFGNWTLSRNIDFVEAGAFESVSDFTVGIINTSAFRAALQSNGIYLGRRKVKYYRVTSSDGATFNFELRWSGVVDDQPFNERLCSLKCVSTFKDLFGTLPNVAANSTTFPNMPKDSQDKMIPIAVGRVAHSPLVNVSGSGERTVLNMMGDPVYPAGFTAEGSNPVYVAACLGYTPKDTSNPEDASPALAQLQIATFGKSFIQGELKGKYVNIIAGGVSQSVLIEDNLKTISIGGPYYTNLYLADNLDVSTPFKVYFYDHADTDFWYAEIVDYAATLISSSKPIYGFNSGNNSPIAIYRYLSDGNIFDSIGETISLSSISNILATGFPGLFAASSTSDNGSLNFYSPVLPSKIYVAGLTGFSGLPAVGSLAPLLNNLNPNDYYTLFTTTGFSDLQLDLVFDSDAVLKQYSSLYMLFDLSHFGPCTIVMRAKAYSLDYIGRLTSSIFNYVVKTSPVGASPEDIFRLPGIYYNITRDDSKFLKDKENYNIQSVIADTKKLSIYNRVRFEISTLLGPSSYTMQLRELGMIGKRTISFTSETVYAALRGEVYGTTMDGRVTAMDFPDTVVRVLEYLIRNYDEKGDPWRAGTYTAGDFVRSTADNGHIFVCTVGGTTAGSEPTWTTAAGATYTDGGVTWKEHHAIRIDTASFDSAASHRGFSFVGRTLTEKKSSLEYYQSLFAQAFLLGVTAPDGKVQVKPWLQNTVPLVAFSEANILPGTLGDVVETPVRRIYNDILIQYDKNPGSGGFNKQIAVTNVDKPAFPGISETVVTGTSLGTFSVSGSMGWPVSTLNFTTALAHGLATLDYVSLTGNADGFNFTPLTVGVTDATHFFVIVPATFAWTASPSTSGTLVKNPVSRLKWQDYVAGIQNYSTARDLWQQCHNSWIVTQVVNKTPTELGQCEWFFDWYAKDANGKYIWSVDGGLTPEYDLGDAHAATGLAEGIANWTAWKKKQVTFEVADTATFSARGLGDCVSFADAKLTTSVALTGWIHEKTQLPKDDTHIERFRFGVTLYPEALSTFVPPNVIEEHGATDSIDEHGATDIIEEHGA